MFQKKRVNQKGSNHPGSKLTWKIVDEIRGRYAEGGISYQELGKKYNISPGNVGRIVRRELWIRE